MFNARKTGKASFYNVEKHQDLQESCENTIREESDSGILKTSMSSELLKKDDSNKRLKMEIKPVLTTETTIVVDPDQLSLSLGDLDKIDEDKDANIDLLKEKLSWITHKNDDPRHKNQLKMSSPEKLKKLHELELDLMKNNVNYLMEKKV